MGEYWEKVESVLVPENGRIRASTAKWKNLGEYRENEEYLQVPKNIQVPKNFQTSTEK